MSKLGIGKALALAAVIALTGGAISLAAKGDEKRSGGESKKEQRDFGPPWMHDGPGRDGPDMDGRGFGGPGFGGPGFGGPPPWALGDGDFGPPSAAELRKERGELAKALGEELGKSQEEVETAFRNVFRDRLDQAVEDGHLTRKEADSILECFEKAECMHPGPPM